VLVIDVQRGRHALGDHAGTKAAGGLLGHPAIEDELDLVGAAEVEVLSNDLFEEHPAGHGPVQHLRQAELGLQDRELVAVAGAPIATLVKVHPLRLVLAVPERAAAGIRAGQEVRVTVDGDPTPYRGRVARLSPSIQEQSRTLTVEAEVPNEQGRLRPGAFAKADIVLAADEPAVFVPASAIVVFAGIEKVLTVREGKSVELRVQTGRREGDRVEIVTGVTAGQPIVMEPGNLVGGQPVSVVQ